jgi:hypothetical protein
MTQDGGSPGVALPVPPWAHLKVVWKNRRPSVREIGALRKLFPVFASVPVTSLLQLPDVLHLQVKCREREARRLQTQAAEMGLNLHVEVEPCHVCSCDLTGNTSGVCPACGSAVT